ncbi:MAG TPA: UDP-N-acetylmuramoyl-L-alanyl-D-glutamate--2,6-diaminopimelate ligase [Gammaproteobacteria bacterium]|nr:UDP-N-acetylmuramoyl-L-alanyl-D-glutamate--2,6-diaminopimelate ligase [Gammaproteobacteria bacterium]
MMAARELANGYRLGALLEGLAELEPDREVTVQGLATDSRRVQPGDLFLARAGRHTHGLRHLDQALAAGAAAVVWEPVPGAAPPAAAVPAVAVPGLGQVLGVIADRFFGHPSGELAVIGVTGTDGKTSCSHFIAQALDEATAPCGLIGTLGYGRYGALDAGTHTTPDAVALQRELAGLRDAGARRVVMEASSHALHQGRTTAVRFHTAVLTNLGRDHLDYHGDLASYADAKRGLFESPGLAHAVLNADDAFGRELLETLSGGLDTLAYGLQALPPDRPGVQGDELVLDPQGLHLRVRSPWGSGTLGTRLLGRFNASNLLGALGALVVLGVPFEQALHRLGQTATVPGRMECFGGGPGQPLVVVDYAHTPQALEQVLGALREHCDGALWCVFGAGGERDAGKRPLMGRVAERLADRVVVTDDNPRNEDATQIVVDILAGLQAPDAVYVERDRGRAIALAVDRARPGDVVLVAGKGHEDYQQIGARRVPFSDREQVRARLGRPS